MADGLQISLGGFDELLSKLRKAPFTLQEDAAAEMRDGVKAIQEEMKLRAPSNFSILRNSISVDPPSRNGLLQGITSGANYSAYVEFGTGTKVDVPEQPEGVVEYALSFKGTHAIPGMYPRPYFFVSILQGIPLILEALQKTVEKAIKVA